MTFRKVFNEKEEWCMVLEPGEFKLSCPALVFGQRNGKGLVQARGEVLIDFGPEVGTLRCMGFELSLGVKVKFHE